MAKVKWFPKSLHEVETRLVFLYWLKAELIPKQRERKKNYIWQSSIPKDPYKSNYKSNTIFSIINAKLAELLTWLQEYDFIPQDGDAMKNVRLIKNIWNYEWIKSKTDKMLAKVASSSLISWDWFAYEWTRKIRRKIQVPKENIDWTISFKEEKILEYSWIYSEYIPWENIYFDWDDIDNSNEVVWIKYWDRKAFINTFGDNPNYSNVNESLPIGKYYYIAASDDCNLEYRTTNDSDNIISELRYYNKSKDKFIILANWIEVYNSYNPYKHKELPFLKMEDYPIDWRFYSMWDFELLKDDEAYKDALRALNIDIIKAQMWFTVVDPDADFDEATVEIWTNKFARVNPKDIGHYSPNINAQNVIQAELKADDDLIIKGWMDYKSQLLWPSETATKTAARTASAKKRINLNLKLNAYSFFERLARLRMSNLQLLYSTGENTIPNKWWSIKNWVLTPDAWYWLFTVRPEDVKWKFNVIPITESILWVSTERSKAKLMEFSQIALTTMWEDGKPVINWAKLIEQLARKLDIDFEALTEKDLWNKTPEDLIKEIDMEDEGQEPQWTNGENYVPPEQRSQTNAKIGWIGWQNNIPLE